MPMIKTAFPGTSKRTLHLVGASKRLSKLLPATPSYRFPTSKADDRIVEYGCQQTRRRNRGWMNEQWHELLLLIRCIFLGRVNRNRRIYLAVHKQRDATEDLPYCCISSI